MMTEKWQSTLILEMSKLITEDVIIIVKNIIQYDAKETGLLQLGDFLTAEECIFTKELINKNLPIFEKAVKLWKS